MKNEELVELFNERLLRIERQVIELRGWLSYLFFIGVILGFLLCGVMK